MQYGGSLRNKLQRDLSNDRKKSEKSEKAQQMYFICSMVVHCETNCNEICPIVENQRTNGPVNAHLISWPSRAQNIHNLENIW